jgi:hypothetical protein
VIVLAPRVPVAEVDVTLVQLVQKGAPTAEKAIDVNTIIPTLPNLRSVFLIYVGPPISWIDSAQALQKVDRVPGRQNLPRFDHSRVVRCERLVIMLT